MISPLSTKDVREVLAHRLLHRDFVTDKTGVRMVEAPGVSFHADEPTIFGELNEEWCWRELDWYTRESLNVNDIQEPVPAIWRQVADKDGFINSNYGWMMWHEDNFCQGSHVVEELRRNPESRRAVAIYTRPSMWQDYNRNGRSDFCCTNAVQYMIRRGKVTAVVQMRSNDAVFGYKGDLFWQRHAQGWVRDCLCLDEEVGLGPIVWQVGSLHLYERHFYLAHHWLETGEHYVSKADYKAFYPDSEWAK